VPRPSIQTIADALGYSKSTVSRALNADRRISTDTRERVLAEARRIGYEVNAYARCLAAQRSGGGYQATLAFVYGHRNRDPLEHVLYHQRIFEGARERAAGLGYRLEPFWAYHPDCAGQRLDRILKTRNIPGVVLTAIKGEELELDWGAYAVAYAGQMLQSIFSFHSCGADYYDAAVTAMRRAAAGGRKVGLLLTESEERYSGGRYLAGFLRERERATGWAAGENLPVFSAVREFRPADLRRWLRRHRPDVVIVADDFLADWLDKKWPGGAPFRIVVLEKLRRESPYPGVRIPYAEIGAGSVDLVIEQLHRGERGLPQNGKVVLRRSAWVDANGSAGPTPVPSV